MPFDFTKELPADFDKESVYDEQVSPLVTQIIATYVTSTLLPPGAATRKLRDAYNALVQNLPSFAITIGPRSEDHGAKAARG